MYYSSLTMAHTAGVLIPFIQMREEDREIKSRGRDSFSHAPQVPAAFNKQQTSSYFKTRHSVLSWKNSEGGNCPVSSHYWYQIGRKRDLFV